MCFVIMSSLTFELEYTYAALSRYVHDDDGEEEEDNDDDDDGCW